MNRIPEPELMDNHEQASAYASTDFSESDHKFIDEFRVNCTVPNDAKILDLGCGPGNITFLLSQKFPEAQITGIDGSQPMLDLAFKKQAESSLHSNITFKKILIPNPILEKGEYDIVVSNSLLHHIHKPDLFWKTVKSATKTGGFIYVVDLFRPVSVQVAKNIVRQYTNEAPKILQKDFYHSLLAAFTPEEISLQLKKNDLSTLEILKISDRHIKVFGIH